MQILERPDHRLHERDVEGLVVILEVDPARLAGNVFLPIVGVPQHGIASSFVEGRDTHLLDFTLLRDAELAHRFEFCGQAVGIPTKSAVHLLAAHGLITGKQIFRIPGEQVAVMGKAIGERRAVVEDPLLAAFPLVDRSAEGVILLPERQDSSFDVGEARIGTQRLGRRTLSCVVIRCGARVRHVSPGRNFICTRTVDDLLIQRGTTPLATSVIELVEIRNDRLFFGCDGPAPFGSTGPLARRFAAVLPKTPR